MAHNSGLLRTSNKKFFGSLLVVGILASTASLASAATFTNSKIKPPTRTAPAASTTTTFEGPFTTAPEAPTTTPKDSPSSASVWCGRTTTESHSVTKRYLHLSNTNYSTTKTLWVIEKPTAIAFVNQPSSIYAQQANTIAQSILSMHGQSIEVTDEFLSLYPTFTFDGFRLRIYTGGGGGSLIMEYVNLDGVRMTASTSSYGSAGLEAQGFHPDYPLSNYVAYGKDQQSGSDYFLDTTTYPPTDTARLLPGNFYFQKVGVLSSVRAYGNTPRGQYIEKGLSVKSSVSNMACEGKFLQQGLS